MGADGRYGLLLQGSQQFPLDFQRQAVDFVKKKRPPGGLFYHALTRCSSSGVCAAHMSKKRIGKNGIIKPGNIHSHQWAVTPTDRMGCRNQIFLPYAGLTGHKQRLGAFGNRSIAIVRELTKIHEEVIRTTLEQAVERYSEAPLKGEIVLVIDGAKPVDNNKVYTEEEAADLAIALAADEDVSLSEASKKAAKETGIKKGIIYKLATERDEVK